MTFFGHFILSLAMRMKNLSQSYLSIGERICLAPVDCFCAMQVSQSRENMTGEIANDRFCNGSTAFTDIFIYRSRINILQIYIEMIINLHAKNEPKS